MGIHCFITLNRRALSETTLSVTTQCYMSNIYSARNLRTRTKSRGYRQINLRFIKRLPYIGALLCFVGRSTGSSLERRQDTVRARVSQAFFPLFQNMVYVGPQLCQCEQSSLPTDSRAPKSLPTAAVAGVLRLPPNQGLSQRCLPFGVIVIQRPIAFANQTDWRLFRLHKPLLRQQFLYKCEILRSMAVELINRFAHK